MELRLELVGNKNPSPWLEIDSRLASKGAAPWLFDGVS
jgi:hypothetical protein